MRDYEKQRLQVIIIAIKRMRKMDFDKYVILNNLDSVIENLRVNASNDFINEFFTFLSSVNSSIIPFAPVAFGQCPPLIAIFIF